jgi:hypothetical protein
VEAERPVVGLHEYVFAPLAVKVVLSPEQIVPGEDEAVTVGVIK